MTGIAERQAGAEKHGRDRQTMRPLTGFARWPVVIAIIAALGGCSEMGLFSAKPQPPVDFATLERPSSPNTYLVCPADRCKATPDRAAEIYSVSGDRLKSAWEAMIAEQDRTERLGQSEDGWQIDYLQRTPLMGFPDNVTVRIFPIDENKSTLAVYGRSQYGYSDMGANKKRVENWLQALETKLGP